MTNGVYTNLTLYKKVLTIHIYNQTHLLSANTSGFFRHFFWRIQPEELSLRYKDKGKEILMTLYRHFG